MPFSPSPYPNLFFLVKGKKRKRERERERKYIVYLKWKQSFILMIDEKAFADFIITCVLIFSFGGFYSYKMYMMRKLHKKSNTTVNVRFSLYGEKKNGCTLLQTKIYDPKILSLFNCFT